MRFTPVHERARAHLWEQWHGRPGINGVGLGQRVRAGEPTGRPAVVVVVTRKYPKVLLRADQVLPEYVEIDGSPVEVDVVRAGPFRLAWNDTSEMPLAPGLSIGGAALNMTGTLGALVIDANGNERLLSSAHVLTGQGVIASPDTTNAVLQPALVEPDGSPAEHGTPTQVGTVVASFYGNDGGGGPGSAFLDAALVEPLPAVTTSPDVPCYLMQSPLPNSAEPAIGLLIATDSQGITQPDQQALPGNFNGLVSPIGPLMDQLGFTFPENDVAYGVVGMWAEKFGAASGYTRNIISAVDMSVTLQDLPGTQAQGLIFVPSFAAVGDSGALVTNPTTVTGGPIGPPAGTVPCELLSVAAQGLAIPDILNHVGDFDQLRDQWLYAFSLGQVIVGTYYLNQTALIDRFNSAITMLQDDGNLASFQSYAQEVYAEYAPQLYAAIENPSLATPMTSADQQELSTILEGLLSYSLISGAEYQIASEVVSTLVSGGVGLDSAGLFAYASEGSTFTSTMSYLQQFVQLGSITLAGPDAISLDPPPYESPSTSQP